MQPKKGPRILVPLIVLLAGIAAGIGIYSSETIPPTKFESIHGQTVDLYGKGIYKYMSADVAVQGIAQDYVTLTLGILLLILGLRGYRRGSVRGGFLLAGTLFYFFVTYLFYTAMGMYNELFLVYVALLGLSFFALFITLRSFNLPTISRHFEERAPNRFVGGFLIFSASAVGLLWLSVVVPPLLDGSIYPDSLEHYTTLIVQGFDLGLLLPLSFASGLLLLKKRPLGWLAGTTYIVFLALLMTALSAKIIAMQQAGVNVIPVIFIIPAINLVAIITAGSLLVRIHTKSTGSS